MRHDRRALQYRRPSSVLPRLYEKVRDSAPRSRKGRVRRLLGVIVHATATEARIGELCHLVDPATGRRVMAEVIGLLDDVAVLTPIGDLFGLSSLTEVIPPAASCWPRSEKACSAASSMHWGTRTANLPIGIATRPVTGTPPSRSVRASSAIQFSLVSVPSMVLSPAHADNASGFSANPASAIHPAGRHRPRYRRGRGGRRAHRRART